MVDVNSVTLKTLKPMTVVELEQIHTGSLLKRLENLRLMHDSFKVSDWLIEEKVAVEAAGLIAFKKSDIWESAYSDVKVELSKREHLSRGSKEKRQQKAWEQKHR